jgi:hypothetical protein
MYAERCVKSVLKDLQSDLALAEQTKIARQNAIKRHKKL